MAIRIAQDPHADEVLTNDSFALLAGMLLDQQFPMERAFAGPAKVLDRFGTLDPSTIADADPEAFADLCATPPAIHRYGRSMAGRLQAWPRSSPTSTTATPRASGPRHERGKALMKRLRALPGFGEQKAKIFTALLAKQPASSPPAGRRSPVTTARRAIAPWPTWSTRTRSPRSARSSRPRRPPREPEPLHASDASSSG